MGTDITTTHDVAAADPRHRSFHLTRPTTGLAAEDEPTHIASGWVRLISSDGRPIAIRISSIVQVVGPYQLDGRWVVRLVSPEEGSEPVGFDSEAAAEHFVEDLVHDD